MLRLEFRIFIRRFDKGMEDKTRPVPLSELLKKYISHSYNELYKLLDENSGEESQKRALMRVLNLVYILGSKLHMAIGFDMKFPRSSELISYLYDSWTYESYLDIYAKQLYDLSYLINETMPPLYDVEGAIDLLIDNCRCRLPLEIYPKLAEPQFSQDPRPFYFLLKNIIRSKLLSVRVPNHIQIKFNRGRIILLVPERYKLYLSVSKVDGPFVAAKLIFLLPNFTHENSSLKRFRPDLRKQAVAFLDMQLNGKDLRTTYIIFQETIAKIISTLNKIFSEDKDPIIAADKLLLNFVYLFDFQRLIIEAKRIRNTRATPLQVSELYGRTVRFFFWKSYFDITLTVTSGVCSLPIKLEGNRIGDAFGKQFDMILGDCMRRVSIQMLKDLQIQVGGELNTDELVPKLKICLVEVYIDRGSFQYTVKGRNDLNYWLNRFRYLEFTTVVNQEYENAKNRTRVAKHQQQKMKESIETAQHSH